MIVREVKNAKICEVTYESLTKLKRYLSLRLDLRFELGPFIYLERGASVDDLLSKNTVGDALELEMIIENLCVVKNDFKYLELCNSAFEEHRQRARGYGPREMEDWHGLFLPLNSSGILYP